MADIRRIRELYELYGTFNRVARELGISHNTVKKYVLRVKSVQDGSASEILAKDRMIIQPPRVLTETVRKKIHSYLESNLGQPRKQRLTAKRIWELLVEESIGYIRRATFGERSSFESFEEATEWLSKRLAEINTKPVYRRISVPVQGLVQERDQMNPLPMLEYENFELKRAAISKY